MLIYYKHKCGGKTVFHDHLFQHLQNSTEDEKKKKNGPSQMEKINLSTI